MEERFKSRSRVRAIFGCLFLLTLSTYPLETKRILMGGIAIPIAAASLVFLCILTLFLFDAAAIDDSRANRKVASVTVALLVLLLVVTMGNDISGAAITPDNYKSLPYLFAVVVLPVVLGRASVRLTLASLLIAMLVPCAVGTLRFWTGQGGIEPEHAIGYWGIRYLPSTRNSDVLYPMVGALCALALMQTRMSTVTKLALGFIAAACVGAVVLSYSRGAWLALIVGALSILWSSPKGRAKSIVGLAFLSIAAAIAVQALQDQGPQGIESVQTRFQSILSGKESDGYSNDSRLLLHGLTAIAVLKKPWGVGVENFEGLFDGTIAPGNAENAYLNIAGEGGLASLVLFILLLVRLYRKSRRADATGPGPEATAMLVLAMSVYFLFNSELNSLLTWSVLGVAAALAGVPEGIASSHQPISKPTNVLR